MSSRGTRCLVLPISFRFSFPPIQSPDPYGAFQVLTIDMAKSEASPRCMVSGLFVVLWKWLFKRGVMMAANEVLWTWMIPSAAVNVVAPKANTLGRYIGPCLVASNSRRTWNENME